MTWAQKSHRLGPTTLWGHIPIPGANVMSNTSKKTPAAKPAKPSPTVKDLPAAADPKGGILIGLLLPAVQKVRG